jgi:Cdc6-like AAA superfamily ATPase
MENVRRVLQPSVAPQDRFDEIRREHIEHSGDWICAEDAYINWSGSEAPILWVSGMPGSGKSFLAYTIITHLRAKFANEEGTAGRTSVGFTFFRDNKNQTRSLEQALRDIAFQLAQTDELYAKHICDCVQNESEVSTIRSAWQKLFVDFFCFGE